jgi:hypothetical protein
MGAFNSVYFSAGDFAAFTLRSVDAFGVKAFVAFSVRLLIIFNGGGLGG